MEKSFNKIGIMITLQISEQQARKMYSTASKELKDNWQIFPVGKRGIDFIG
jgi:hypothetical protein